MNVAELQTVLDLYGKVDHSPKMKSEILRSVVGGPFTSVEGARSAMSLGFDKHNKYS